MKPIKNGRGARGTWWIDRGKWHNTQDNAPFHKHNLTLPFDDLGLLHLDLSGEAATVRWTVDSVEESSLSQCLDFLQSLNPDTAVKLHFCKEAWADELHDRESAIKRIEEVQRYRGVELLATTCIQEENLSLISKSEPEIKSVYAAWLRDKSANEIKSDRAGSLGLYSVPDKGELALEYVGTDSECKRILGNAWAQSAIGTPAYRAFADNSYTDRVYGSYHTCHDERRPIFEHIHGRLDLGTYCTWMPYQRLILPTLDGIATFTKITENIDIPFLRC